MVIKKYDDKGDKKKGGKKETDKFRIKDLANWNIYNKYTIDNEKGCFRK